MSLPRPRVSTWPVAALVWLLSACGAETAGTAATAGAIKKNEIEQGRVVQEQVQQRLQQSLDQTQQRADQMEQATR
jgi:NAD(P)H-dependent FMN reductase